MKYYTFLACATLIAFADTSVATTIEDAAAGYTIELPDGFTEMDRRNAAGTTVINFGKDGAPVITLSAIPLETGFDDNAELFEMQTETIEETLGGTMTVLELHDFELGGMPARWGWMEKTDSDYGKVYAGVGAVELDDIQVTFSAAIRDELHAEWQGAIETSFLSIRNHGDEIGEVQNRVAANRSKAEEVVLAEASTYDHPLFSLDLPKGWEATTNSTNPKAINMALLKRPPGNTVTVLCLSGFGASKKGMEEAVASGMSSNIPNIDLLRQDTVKAANGKKTKLSIYQGKTESQGTTVVLNGVTGTLKHKKCHLGFIGLSPAVAGNQLVDEMLGIVKSVH